MKIIITGVAGFIGSNLAKALLNMNHEIIGIDNLSYGLMRNIEPISSHKNFTFILDDLKESSSLKNITGNVIVHLASQKIPRYTSALITLDENSDMLKNIIRKCL